MGTHRSSVRALVCVALLPAPAWTQETATAAVQEVVVTASALGTSVGTDAASAGVAGAEQLANRPLERTGELLDASSIEPSAATRRKVWNSPRSTGRQP